MDVGSLPKKVWAVSRDAAHYKQWDSIGKTRLTATLKLTLGPIFQEIKDILHSKEHGGPSHRSRAGL